MFGRMDRGGAETMIMGIYRNINRNKMQFDFVVHTDDVCSYDNEIKRLGGRIFHIPRFNGRNIFEYKKSWKKLLSEHPEWRIVHGHIRSTAFIYLKIAKRFGLFSIVHSHSTSTESGFQGKMKSILQYRLRGKANFYMACSRESGEWLFGKSICNSDKFLVIKNSIDVSNFIFNKQIRETMRRKLALNDYFVIGHVGRFIDVKNHFYLIDIFCEILKICENSKLILVGDGILKDDVLHYAQSKQISDNVIMLGTREDVNTLLNAFDIFLLPSKYEGVPLVLIEAQASGLVTFTSDSVISEEVSVTPLLNSVKLSDPPIEWANRIIKYKDGYTRENWLTEICNAGYDSKSNAAFLYNFYVSCISRF